MQWLYLVQTISTDVVARLAAAGIAPLVDGAILLGPEHVNENASPNRIVFVPRSSTFTPRDASMRWGIAAATAPSGAGVLSIPVQNHGKTYTTATVSVSPPDLAGGVQATASAVLQSGVVHRVQMTAMGSGYTSPPAVTITGNGTGATAQAVLAPTVEALAGLAQNALWTEWQRYDVYLWGCTYTADVPPAAATNPDTDWDATAQLGLILAQSLRELACGVHHLGPMEWMSSLPEASKLQILGRYARMQVEIAVPVPDLAYELAPVGTHANPTVSILLPDGTTTDPVNLE